MGKRIMAEELKSEFFVTLLSNASANYFPSNTQSSFRTKLSAPLMLNAEYEVAIVETFIPRNWFNIGNHNNAYTLTSITKERIPLEYVEKEIEFETITEENSFDFSERINNLIRFQSNYENGVRFVPQEDNIEILLEKGFEVQFFAGSTEKLLYMLHQPKEDVSISSSKVFNFRSTTADSVIQSFKIINRNPRSITSYLIPILNIKDKAVPPSNAVMFEEMSYNIQALNLENFVEISYDDTRAEVEIKIDRQAEIVFNKNKSPILMQKLGIKNDLTVTGVRKFTVNPSPELIPDNETVDLRVKEFHVGIEERRSVQNMFLDIGHYSKADMLFRSFQIIQLMLLPNKKVRLYVPDLHEIEFSKELAAMLGFEETSFISGVYDGKYELELDSGVTEILIYSDLIASHHVGDSFAPLLRVIPCMSEKEEQIVKHFHTPFYFPLRKHFIDTIEIELKTSSGENIIFSGGKTHIVLSFRRRV